MTWIKLNDSVPDHDRIVRAGDRAAWLWVCGLCWSSRHLADGKLPYDVIPRLGGQPDGYELADGLVAVGLWKRTKAGFTIHNYDKFQRTKTQVEGERESGRKRQQRRRVSRRDMPVSHADVTEPEKSRDREEPPKPPARRGAYSRQQEQGLERMRIPDVFRCKRCDQLNIDCECPPLTVVTEAQ